jgi:hypothetical protein
MSRPLKGSMNHTGIIKRAWRTLLRYRTLWLFGFVLAMTTFSWSTLAIMSRASDEDVSDAGIEITRRPGETFAEAIERSLKEELESGQDELDRLLEELLGISVAYDLSALLVLVAAIIVAFYLVGRIARYLAETALIRLVDDYAGTGVQHTVRHGLRLAWSRTAWRLFFIELLINLVAAAAGLLLFALIFAPLPLWVEGEETTIWIGAIVTAGLFFLAVFLVILWAMGVALVKLMARRACALEGLGVTGAVYRGYTLVRQNLRKLLPLGLVTLGVNVGWPVLIGLLLVLLFGVGVLLGGLPALLVGSIASRVAAGETAIVLAAIIGAIILLLVLIAPLLLLGGMREVFISSMWTLTYRTLCDLEREVQASPPDLVMDREGRVSA